mmetsp:Transcript_12872/g.34293  ORF Transcript_12872/g.34293 Transcript_12872/m.34293 type:complete len:266 (+) Transcript_12872:515-1312(+)
MLIAIYWEKVLFTKEFEGTPLRLRAARCYDVTPSHQSQLHSKLPRPSRRGGDYNTLTVTQICLVVQRANGDSATDVDGCHVSSVDVMDSARRRDAHEALRRRCSHVLGERPTYERDDVTHGKFACAVNVRTVCCRLAWYFCRIWSKCLDDGAPFGAHGESVVVRVVAFEPVLRSAPERFAPSVDSRDENTQEHLRSCWFFLGQDERLYRLGERRRRLSCPCALVRRTRITVVDMCFRIHSLFFFRACLRSPTRMLQRAGTRMRAG